MDYNEVKKEILKISRRIREETDNISFCSDRIKVSKHKIETLNLQMQHFINKINKED